MIFEHYSQLFAFFIALLFFFFFFCISLPAWNNRRVCVLSVRVCVAKTLPEACLSCLRGKGFIDVYQGWIDQRLPRDRRSITHQIKDGNPLIKQREKGGEKPALTSFFFSLPLLSQSIIHHYSLLNLKSSLLSPITCHLVYLTILKRTFFFFLAERGCLERSALKSATCAYVCVIFRAIGGGDAFFKKNKTHTHTHIRVAGQGGSSCAPRS